MDVASEKLVSPASYWEIAIKYQYWKIRPRRAVRGVHAPCDRRQRIPLPAYPDTAHGTVDVLTVSPSRPFDRLLVAQAIVEDIPIVSNDPALDAYAVKRLC
jgi:PIN domain nuclease of toxin-antitoxin system